jgi:tryptophan 2,3-dioxygenase
VTPTAVTPKQTKTRTALTWPILSRVSFGKYRNLRHRLMAFSRFQTQLRSIYSIEQANNAMLVLKGLVSLKYCFNTLSVVDT